ncbi:MAG TPA: adenylosuccinate synthase, partial [Candidatus Poseidoniaceae archaeon]
VELLADDAALTAMAARMTASLAAGGLDEPITADDLRKDLSWVQTTYASSIANTGLMLDHALSLGERIILEGAQGCLLDIDQGT